MKTKPTAVILNIPVRAAFERLVAAGLKVNLRTLGDELRIMERQRGAAPDVKAFRHGGRIDSAGNVRSDTGTPILGGWEGSQHEAITLRDVVADITENGYSLVGVNLVQKVDKQPSLYLRFEENPESDRLFPLWESLSTEIVSLLGRFYRNFHIYDNSKGDGTMTLNPSGAINPTDVDKLQDPRTVHMTSDFGIRNVKIDRDQPTVRRADQAPVVVVVEEPRRERRPRREYDITPES